MLTPKQQRIVNRYYYNHTDSYDTWRTSPAYSAWWRLVKYFKALNVQRTERRMFQVAFENA